MDSGTRKTTIKTMVLTLGGVIVLAAVVALFTVISGAYDVAATRPHRPLTVSLLSSLMDNSVRHHASDIELSPAFNDPDLGEGFEHYQAMCVVCHGAPGVQKGEIGEGLNPPAPDLAETAPDLSPQEVFWILKNGIKMTGMPAFGPTHDDEKLWNLAAFVKNLPAMTPDRYRHLADDGDDGDEGDGHDHDHHH